MSKRVSNKKGPPRKHRPSRSYVRLGFWKRRQRMREQEERIKASIVETPI